MSDAKLVNTEAYDHLADWYLSWVSAQISPRERYAAKVLEKYNPKNNGNGNGKDNDNDLGEIKDQITSVPSSSSPPSSSPPPPPPQPQPQQPPYILELGCGPGHPITTLLLSAGARVIANDISPAQIAKAKLHSHSHAHSSRVTFIASDMTLLSLPPSTLDGAICFFTLFHLPRAEQPPMLSKIFSWLKIGALLVCNFATFDEEEIYGEMMGMGIFWSGFDVGQNRAMLVDAGFEIEEEEVLESEADGGNEFQWVAARKTRA